MNSVLRSIQLRQHTVPMSLGSKRIVSLDAAPNLPCGDQRQASPSFISKKRLRTSKRGNNLTRYQKVAIRISNRNQTTDKHMGHRRLRFLHRCLKTHIPVADSTLRRHNRGFKRLRLGQNKHTVIDLGPALDPAAKTHCAIEQGIQAT